MDLKYMGGLIAGLIVGVLLITTVAIPIINSSTETHETFDNTPYGFYSMKPLEIGDMWVKTDGTWYYGDTALTGDSLDNVSIVATDNLALRQNNQIRGTTISNNNTTSAEVIEADGIAILETNGVSHINYDSGFGATPAGDYVMKTYSASAYVKGDTPLWVTGVTGMGIGGSNGNVIVHIEGTIDDGLTITATKVFNGGFGDLTIGEYTLNYQEVNGYEDLYKITSVVFDITGTYTGEDNPTTTTATYSTFIIPKTVTAELSYHPNESESTLIGIIPLLMVVGLVIAIIGAVLIHRE